MDPKRPNNNFIARLKTIDKKILVAVLVFLPLGLFILFLIIIPTTRNAPVPRTHIVTPTKFILHNSLLSLSPQPDSNNVAIYAPIAAVFKNPVVESEKYQIRILLEPSISGEASWSTDNKTITFTPAKSFNPNTSYKATLNLIDTKQIWMFKTVPSSKVSDEDALRKQSESDVETQKALQEFYKNYPWWDRFPLKTDSYFVYFHPERKIFIGLLYPNKSSSASVDQQVNNMKSEIQATIRGFNIQIEDYGIEWKIIPEP